MILSAIVALGVLFIAFVDYVYLRKVNRRAFRLEYAGFAIVLMIFIKPEWFSEAARALGIARGVDVVIYPMMIWLFRETILGRVRYYRSRAEITALVRQLAIRSLTEIDAASTERKASP